MVSKHELQPWRVIAHFAAFAIAAGIGAILIYPAYPILEHDTDSPAEAREAFLAAIGIVGCLGPGIMAAIFWLHGKLRRSSGDSPAEDDADLTKR